MSNRLKDTVLCVCVSVCVCVCVLLSALTSVNRRILVMALQNLMQGCKCSVWSVKRGHMPWIVSKGDVSERTVNTMQVGVHRGHEKLYNEYVDDLY